MQVMMRETFNDSVENLWATISDFGGLGRYFSPVVKCKLEGSGVGARRIVTLKTPTGDEAIVVERLDLLDAKSKTLSYSIPDATGFPFKDGYVGTMQLKDLGNKMCELEWTALIEAPEDTPEQVTRDFVRGVYETGIMGLKRLHGG
jgi:Polyketide cyclase / dehydrase and lipid transport